MPAVGEAAELKVLLTLQDQLSPALAGVQARVKELQGSGTSGLSGLSGVASKVETAFGKVGTALSHAESQIGGLVKNIGLFGGAIGLFSAAGAVKSAIDTANTMAKSIETLTALTGEDATTVSKLLAVFERFGVSTDTATTRLAFMEKTLGTLANNTKALTALQQTYGISLTDSSGHIVDVNTALQRLADYMNGTASAADKAKVASTLLGRGYVDLLPVLSQGSAGIAAVEAQAQALGNTLSQHQVDQLMQYQTAMRDMGEAMQGLGLQIAVTLVPALRDLAVNITRFVETNRGQIIDFFRNAAKFAQDFGHWIETSVVPAVRGIIGAWNAIPGPLKDFLIQAFVAGKVSKFLFDVNIPGALLTLGARWAGDFLYGMAQGVVDTIKYAASFLTGVPAATEMEGAMQTGGLTAAAEIEGAMSTGGANAAGEIRGAMATGALGIGGAIAAGLGGAAALLATGPLHDLENAISKFFGGKPLNYYQGPPGSSPFTQSVTPNPISSYGQPGFFGGAPLPPAVMPDLYGMLPTDASGAGSLDYVKTAANGLAGALQSATAILHDWGKELSAADKALRTIRNPKASGASMVTAADALTAYYTDRSVGALGGVKNATEHVQSAIKTLNADEKAAAARGDTATANKLKSDIAALQGKLASLQSTTNSLLHTISNKKTTFISNVYADLSVSIRSQQSQNFRSNLYGRSIAV